MGFSLVAMLVALLGGAVGHAAAPPSAPIEAPPGSHPQLAFFEQFSKPGKVPEIVAIGPDGGEGVHLAGGDSEPERTGLLPIQPTNVSWSADGSRFAVMAIRGLHYQSIYVVDPDDGSRHHVRHTYPQDRIEGNAVLSPDGRSVDFLRFVPLDKSRPQGKGRFAIFSVDVESGRIHRATPWLNGLFYPSAFTPDGRSLIGTLEEGPEPEAAEMALGSGKVTVWAHDAQEPALAPDGTMVAVRDIYPPPDPPPPKNLEASDLLVIPAPGEETTILHQSGGIASPSWDPSGARIAYTRLLGRIPVERGILRHNSLEEINADGSCRQVVVEAQGRYGSVSGPSWRPGPERQAGTIRC